MALSDAARYGSKTGVCSASQRGGVKRRTFAARRGSSATLGRLGLAEALYMDLLRLSELPAVLALCDWTTFLFYLDKWASAVCASRAPMALDAACAAEFLSIE